MSGSCNGKHSTDHEVAKVGTSKWQVVYTTHNNYELLSGYVRLLITDCKQIPSLADLNIAVTLF